MEILKSSFKYGNLHLKDEVSTEKAPKPNWSSAPSDVLSEALRLVVGPELDPVVEDGSVQGGELVTLHQRLAFFSTRYRIL